ncbi:MAG: sugar ABC transporter ATP-binding protein [Acidobacteria bacterium]|nr:MAG: sugar ABC transporter ATP-binding protein [Acidobacteriota bacterium]
MNTHPAAEMLHINKSFGGIDALKDVSFDLRAGEVHALVGENGAGKSTLMRILAGACQKDSGVVRIQGRPVEIRHPSVARKLGIGMINQELALAPDLSVAENIFLGDLSEGKGWISRKTLHRKTQALIRSVGFDIDPRSFLGDLSVAHQQVVEICKALSENLAVLILDEPTAVLSSRDVDSLFDTLAVLKQNGVAICYISHRLEEVFRIADRITVAKDGRIAGSVSPRDATPDTVIRLMIGRSLTSMYPVRDYSGGSEVLRVQGLTCGTKFRDASFTVSAGEVLGIAGLVGSGRTELVRAPGSWRKPSCQKKTSCGWRWWRLTHRQTDRLTREERMGRAWRFLVKYNTVVIFLVMFLVAGWASDAFFTEKNLFNLLRQVAGLGKLVTGNDREGDQVFSVEKVAVGATHSTGVDPDQDIIRASLRLRTCLDCQFPGLR